MPLMFDYACEKDRKTVLWKKVRKYKQAEADGWCTESAIVVGQDIEYAKLRDLKELHGYSWEDTIDLFIMQEAMGVLYE